MTACELIGADDFLRKWSFLLWFAIFNSTRILLNILPQPRLLGLIGSIIKRPATAPGRQPHFHIVHTTTESHRCQVYNLSADRGIFDTPRLCNYTVLER